MLYTVNRKIPVHITLTPREVACAMWDFTSEEQLEVLERLFDEIEQAGFDETEQDGFDILSLQLQHIADKKKNAKTLFMMREIAKHFSC